jgi:tetratricopeptide (TPR) repeat protein
VHAFEEDPIGGLGAGGFEQWWGRHASIPVFVRNPHSLPLQQAAELGIPGIALFLGFGGALLLAARRRFAEGLDGDSGVLAAVVATGAVGSLVDWTWETPAVFGPTVVCAALLLGSAPSRRLARNGYWLGIATVAAAWVAMIAGGLVVLSELDLRQSRSDAAAGRLDQAIDRAHAARTVQPWSADSYTQLALVEEERGNYDTALSYLKQAEQRNSEDWRLALIEARLQAERGDGPAATLAYVHARDLSPFTPIVYGGS